MASASDVIGVPDEHDGGAHDADEHDANGDREGTRDAFAGTHDTDSGG